MAVTKYQLMPTKQRWLSDSSVSMATRAKDPVLMHIDDLVGAYDEAPQARYATLPDLYFTLDYWLKIAPGNKLMEKGRTPAVQALYERVAHDMCWMLNCTINSLPRELELTYGRNVTADGNKTDYKFGRARFMEKAEREKYRILWRNGRAHQVNWWEPGAPPKIKLAESSHGAAEIRRGGANGATNQLAGFSGFVLSMSRTFYMTKHDIGARDGHNGVFHSSYLDGGAIAAAGTILIEQGKVRALRSDSGHYQPGDINMQQALLSLTMVGVSLGDVEVINWSGDVRVPAAEFLRHPPARAAFRDARTKNIADNQAAYYEKPGHGDLSKFPTREDFRNRWAKPPELAPGFNPAAFKAPRL